MAVFGTIDAATFGNDVAVTNGDTFRLPSGYKANEFEVEISGSVSVNEVCVYESSEEINVQ